MGCCQSSTNGGAFSLSGGLDNYIKSKESKFQEVVQKGPLIPVYSENHAQADSLPRNPLKVYDLDGLETELHFETEAIFSNPEKGTPDRIFYNEIKRFKFIPMSGFDNSFVILALDTKLGYRAFVFVQKRYTNIIQRVLSSN